MAQLISPSELMYTEFEPKLKMRYIFYIDGIASYLIKKATRPKLSQAVVQLDHINVQRYTKGKSKWDSTTIELYDPIVPSGAQMVMEWVRQHHESLTGRDGYWDMYAKDCTCLVLGPLGDKVEEWTWKGAWIENADFGDTDWADESTPMTINLTIRFNYPVHQY